MAIAVPPHRPSRVTLLALLLASCKAGAPSPTPTPVPVPLLERTAASNEAPPADAGHQGSAAALADAGPPEEPAPVCRDPVWRGVASAMARWCRDPAATMQPYPYGWTAAATKRRGCLDVQRGLASCGADTHVRREDADTFEVNVPYTDVEATYWIASVVQQAGAFRVDSFAIVEDCTGP